MYTVKLFATSLGIHQIAADLAGAGLTKPVDLRRHVMRLPNLPSDFDPASGLCTAATEDIKLVWDVLGFRICIHMSFLMQDAALR